MTNTVAYYNWELFLATKSFQYPDPLWLNGKARENKPSKLRIKVLLPTPGKQKYRPKNNICRIFEHFAILTDPVTEFLKLRSALHRKASFWRQIKQICLPLKISGSTFPPRKVYLLCIFANPDPVT